MKIIKTNYRDLQNYLDEVPVLSRTPGIRDNHYLRVSVSAQGQPWVPLSNEKPAIEQLANLHTSYGCTLDVEIFIRPIDDGNTEPMKLSQLYP